MSLGLKDMNYISMDRYNEMQQRAEKAEAECEKLRNEVAQEHEAWKASDVWANYYRHECEKLRALLLSMGVKVTIDANYYRHECEKLRALLLSMGVKVTIDANYYRHECEKLRALLLSMGVKVTIDAALKEGK
jgi:predicted kinase